MLYSIKAAAMRTGLSAHVIRVWEKRYGAVTPERTGTNRRRYSDTEIERLAMLRNATLAGHSIGTIATLPSEELRALFSAASGPVGVSKTEAGVSAPAASAPGARYVEKAFGFVRDLDTTGLEEVFEESLVALGHHGLLHHVVGPLAHALGEGWREGRITAAHEHFASAAIRVFLGNASRPIAVADHAPGLTVATPAGQLHELGAVMVAAAATHLGWRVTYLGASLPAAEIAGAAVQNRSRAVALSLVYPEDDPNVPSELLALRKYLPRDTQILVGGRCARAYEEPVFQIGGVLVRDIQDVYGALEAIRARTRRS